MLHQILYKGVDRLAGGVDRAGDDLAKGGKAGSARAGSPDDSADGIVLIDPAKLHGIVCIYHDNDVAEIGADSVDHLFLRIGELQIALAGFKVGRGAVVGVDTVEIGVGIRNDRVGTLLVAVGAVDQQAHIPRQVSAFAAASGDYDNSSIGEVLRAVHQLIGIYADRLGKLPALRGDGSCAGGCALFVRKKNRIEFNDAGQIALAEARKVLAAVDDMTKTMQFYIRSANALAVGACAPGPVWEITPDLTRYYPEKTVMTQMHPTEMLIEGLRRREFGLIITDRPFGNPDILCGFYCQEDLKISLPEDHPLAEKASVTCADLEGETMLLTVQLGIWQKFVDEKMQKTHFVVIPRDLPEEGLAKMAGFPSFVTNLSLIHFPAYQSYMERQKGRVTVPLSDPDASIRFYLCVWKEDQSLWARVIGMRAENNGDLLRTP